MRLKAIVSTAITDCWPFRNVCSDGKRVVPRPYDG
jgi:hypothetical protein